MSEANKALIRRWFDEVWNQGSEEAIDEMMADDVSIYALPPETMSSREAFKEFYRPFIAAFPELHVSVEEVFAEGDRVGFRCRVQATHRNGRRCQFDGGGFARVRDGKLAEGHNVWNFHELLEQLGAIPPNALMDAVSGAGGSSSTRIEPRPRG
ncbi:MAG TPA: ester cyclase [Longimicrobiaceae bacterium]|nr:ester cyclase [Longimicrobiaceae bacterium]